MTVYAAVASPKGQMRLHAALMVLWAALVVPTITTWHNSILWVGFVSIYANVATHWGAFEGARTEVRTEKVQKEMDQ